MARTHKEVRLLKPADRTTEMRAVDGEDLKLISLHAPYPTWDIGCLSVPGPSVRVLVFRQARLVLRETGNWPKRNPRLERTCPAKAGEHITEDWHTHKQGTNTVQEEAEL